MRNSEKGDRYRIERSIDLDYSQTPKNIDFRFIVLGFTLKPRKSDNPYYPDWPFEGGPY